MSVIVLFSISSFLLSQEQNIDDAIEKRVIQIIDSIDTDIKNNNQNKAIVALETLAQITKKYPDYYVYSMKKAIFCFESCREFYSLETFRNYITEICAPVPLEIVGVGNQIDLVLLYLHKRDVHKLSKQNFAKIRKQDTSMLLVLWNKCENASNIDNKELQYPDSFFGNGPFVVDHHTPVFQDIKEEERYKTYIVNIKNIAQKNRDKKDAIFILEQKKENVIKSLVSLYSQPPFDTHELATLLKEYNIDKEFSKEILDAVKKADKNK